MNLLLKAASCVMVLFFSLSISAQSKTVSYSTTPSTDSSVDGVSHQQYMSTIQQFSKCITLVSEDEKNTSFAIDLSDLDVKGEDLNSLVKSVNAAGEMNASIVDLTSNKIGITANAGKYSLEDIAHAVLWKNGIR